MEDISEAQLSVVEPLLAEEAQVQMSDEAKVARIEAELGIVDPTTGKEIPTAEENEEARDLEIKKLEQYFGIAEEEEPSLAEGVGDEVVRQIKESPSTQIFAGLLEGGQEMLNLGIDLADWVDNNVGSNIIPDGTKIDVVNRMFPDSDEASLQIARKISQFLVPFGAVSKVAKVGKATGLARTGKAALAGFVADMAAQSPDEGTLSDLMQEVPELSPFVVDYLTTNESDSRAEVRFKNGLEGLGLGVLADGVFRAVKFMGKKAKFLKQTKKADSISAGASPEDVLKMDEPPVVKEAAEDLADPPPMQEIEPQGNFLEIDPEKLTKEGNITGKVVNINLDKYDGKDLKAVIKNFSEENKAFLENARGKYTPEKEVIKLADDLGITVEQLIAKRGEAFTDSEITAARVLLSSQAEDLAEKAAKAVGGSDADKVAFLESQQIFAALSETVSGAAARAGRSLRAFKSTVSPNQKFREQMMRQYIDGMGGDVTVENMAKQLREIKEVNPQDYVKQAGKIIRKSKFAKLNEAIYEVRIGNLLAAPTTQIVNITSNAFQTGLAVGESGIMSVFGQQAKGSTKAMVKGMLSGSKEVLSQSSIARMRVVRNLLDTFGLFKQSSDTLKLLTPNASKIENHFRPALTAERFGLKPIQQNFEDFSFSDILGTIIEGAGKFSRASLSLLQRSDDAFRIINARGKLFQMAHQEALVKGVAGEEYDKFVKNFLENPPDDFRLLADQFSKEQTFTNELSGIFKQINDATNIGSGTRLFGDVGPLRYFVPFSRTNLNIVRQSIMRTPFSYFLDDVSTTLKAGGPDAFLAKARIAYGTAFFSGAGILASQGILTGGAPKNANKRKMWYAAGNQPYSIKFGDTNIQFRELGGLGVALKAAVDAGQILSYTPPEDGDMVAGLTEAVVTTIGHLFTPEFLMGGMGELTKIIEAGERGEYAREKFLTNVMVSATPVAGSRVFENMRRFKDPLRRDTITREEQFSYLDQYMKELTNRIPGLSDTLPPQRNIWGEPIEYAKGFVAGHVDPFYMSEEDKSPAMQEILRLGGGGLAQPENFAPADKHLTIGMPQKKIQKNGVVVKLTGEEYSRLVELAAGVNLRPEFNPGGGRTLKEMLNFIVQQPHYKALADRDKIKEIGSIVSTYRSAAKQQLILETQDIQRDFNDKRLEIRNERLRALEESRGGADVGF